MPPHLAYQGTPRSPLLGATARPGPQAVAAAGAPELLHQLHLQQLQWSLVCARVRQSLAVRKDKVRWAGGCAVVIVM